MDNMYSQGIPEAVSGLPNQRELYWGGVENPEFTDGAWTYEYRPAVGRRKDYGEIHAHTGSGGYETVVVALLPRGYGADREKNQRANGRLLSAAPSMLRALMLIRDELNVLGDTIDIGKITELVNGAVRRAAKTE